MELASWLKIVSDNIQCREVSDCLTKHNVAFVCDQIVMISDDNLCTCEYGSDVTILKQWAVLRNLHLLYSLY